MDMRTGRRIIAVILLLCLVSPLSGCWNRRELNTLGIVGMVGLDIAEGKFITTIEVAKPRKAEGGSDQAASYVQTSGLVMFDSFRNATLKFDRKLFFPHARVYLFGEDVARNGLANYIDMIFRDAELRLATPCFIVQGTSAAEIMGLAAGISDVPSNYLESIWRGQKSNGKSVNVTVMDFVKIYFSKGKNAVVGVVRKVKKQKVMEQDKGFELSTEGAAVFVKDRLVGFLDGEETRGYNWVAGKTANWLAVGPDPGGEGRITVEVLEKKSEKDVEIVGGVVTIKAKIAIRGRVGEESGPADLTDPVEISNLEAGAAQVIKAEVERTLTKVQREYRSDVFGFGQVVHRKYPQEWQKVSDNWDDTFAGANTTVVVEVTIAQSGKSNHSFKK